MGQTILLVDDATVVVQGVDFVLRKNGFRTLCASSVDEAVRLMEANAAELPSLVICDLNMKGKTGLDFAKILKGKPEWANIPFLMLTTESSRQVANQGKALGISGWMVKPFEEKTLVEAVTKLAGGKTS